MPIPWYQVIADDKTLDKGPCMMSKGKTLWFEKQTNTLKTLDKNIQWCTICDTGYKAAFTIVKQTAIYSYGVYVNKRMAWLNLSIQGNLHV